MVSTYPTIHFSTASFWPNLSAKHPDPGWLAHIRLCWKNWRAKGVLRSITKGTKLLLFLGLWRFNGQILHSTFHTHFTWVSSIDSVERNGVQKAFFGQPQKIKSVTFCEFVEIQGQNSPFNFPCRLYLSVVNRFCWKKRRAKVVLRSITKGAKLLLFAGLSRFKGFKVQILYYRFHAFLGQPEKAQNCCFLSVCQNIKISMLAFLSLEILGNYWVNATKDHLGEDNPQSGKVTIFSLQPLYKTLDVSRIILWHVKSNQKSRSTFQTRLLGQNINIFNFSWHFLKDLRTSRIAHFEAKQGFQQK